MLSLKIAVYNVHCLFWYGPSKTSKNVSLLLHMFLTEGKQFCLNIEIIFSRRKWCHDLDPSSLFQALGCWGRAKASERKNEGGLSRGWKGRENIFNEPLPHTLGLMRCRKVEMSICQLAEYILLLPAYSCRAYTNPVVRDILCAFVALFSASQPFSASFVKGTLCSEIIRRNFK